jgi:hypothetical protein
MITLLRLLLLGVGLWRPAALAYLYAERVLFQPPAAVVHRRLVPFTRVPWATATPWPSSTSPTPTPASPSSSATATPRTWATSSQVLASSGTPGSPSSPTTTGATARARAAGPRSEGRGGRGGRLPVRRRGAGHPDRPTHPPWPLPRLRAHPRAGHPARGGGGGAGERVRQRAPRHHPGPDSRSTITTTWPGPPLQARSW